MQAGHYVVHAVYYLVYLVLDFLTINKSLVYRVQKYECDVLFLFKWELKLKMPFIMKIKVLYVNVCN